MASKPMFKKLAISTALMSFSAVASATILTSIKPLGFIASSIANGVTDTKVLVPAGASPHDYSLKPSDIQKLKNAELVVWIGKDVDEFLDKSVHNLPENKLLTIANIPAIDEDVLLTGHHHHHHHHDHDEANEEHHHDHDEAHEEHHHEHDEAYEEHHHDHDEAHEEHHHDHDEAHEEHHHDHDEAHEEHHHDMDDKGINWHIWYSPEISRIIANNIAQKLIHDYPNKKVKIEQNLADFNKSLTQANNKIYKELKPVEGKGFYVFHDAYTYFNKAYHLNQLGYFTINPLVAPGVKKLVEIKQEIAEHKVQCLFAEPQFTPKVIQKLSESTGVKVGVLDPMGDKVALGKDSYANFLQSMANSYLQCLK